MPKMAPGASTKGLEQVFSGLWRANIGSTVHFHGPGMPFLESLGRMASGVKPTPWPTPCSRAPKTMKKKMAQNSCVGPHMSGGGGGAQIQKKNCAKLAESWPVVSENLPPYFGGPGSNGTRPRSQLPVKHPMREGGGGAGDP